MTDPTWGNVLTRMAAIAGQIPGITKAYAKIPRTLTKANLPTVVFIPSRASRSRPSLEELSETRDFKLELYLADATAGIEYEIQDDLDTGGFLENVPAEFFQRPQLQLNDTGILPIPLEVGIDEGLQLLEYPANSKNYYLGIIFTLRITRRRFLPIKTQSTQ